MNITTIEKECIIYGAGDFGERLYQFFKENNIITDYFCQSTISDKTELFGIPIIQLEELKNRKTRKIVCIAIHDVEISRQIKFKLANILQDEDEVIECGSFIASNLSQMGFQKKCKICQSKIKDFLPGGHVYDIFEKHNIIGGGFRAKCICPVCGSHDRVRWCFEVLKRHTKIFETKCTVLHFAPEDGIKNRIMYNELCDYYSGDIQNGMAANIIDVTDIQYKEDFFDYIIINHVLEHIPDIEKAVNELKRVLKKNGEIIMSFPICTDTPTIEDRLCISAEERIEKFGQADHVRLFGYDYLSKLEQMGLDAEVYSPEKECTEEEIEKFGFTYNDVILKCRSVHLV